MNVVMRRAMNARSGAASCAVAINAIAAAELVVRFIPQSWPSGVRPAKRSAM
jgi:hypothetical protein